MQNSVLYYQRSSVIAAAAFGVAVLVCYPACATETKPAVSVQLVEQKTVALAGYSAGSCSLHPQLRIQRKPYEVLPQTPESLRVSLPTIKIK